jgi:hypothetical protein
MVPANKSAVQEITKPARAGFVISYSIPTTVECTRTCQTGLS